MTVDIRLQDHSNIKETMVNQLDILEDGGITRNARAVKVMGSR